MRQYNSIAEVIESLKTDEITPKQAVSIVCKAMGIIDLTKHDITKQYVRDGNTIISMHEIIEKKERVNSWY